MPPQTVSFCESTYMVFKRSFCLEKKVPNIIDIDHRPIVEQSTHSTHRVRNLEMAA